MGGAKAGWGDDEWIPSCRKHHRMLDEGEEWVVAVVKAAAPLYWRSLT